MVLLKKGIVDCKIRAKKQVRQIIEGILGGVKHINQSFINSYINGDGFNAYTNFGVIKTLEILKLQSENVKDDLEECEQQLSTLVNSILELQEKEDETNTMINSLDVDPDTP